MKILSCDCPLTRAKYKQVKVIFRQFSTNLFSFVCSFRFHHFKMSGKVPLSLLLLFSNCNNSGKFDEAHCLCNIPLKEMDESFYKYFPVTNGGLGDDTP